MASARAAIEAAGEFTMLTAGIADHFRRGRAAAAAVPGVATLVGVPETSGAAIRASLYETTAETLRDPASG